MPRRSKTTQTTDPLAIRGTCKGKNEGTLSSNEGTAYRLYDCGLAITPQLLESLEADELETIQEAHRVHHDENHESHGAAWSLHETKNTDQDPDLEELVETIFVYCPGAEANAAMLTRRSPMPRD